MSKPSIVILGAGYGGIVAALGLQKRLNYNEADITLVNKNDYHYITTELHQPAAGTMHHDQARVGIKELIDEKKIKFVKDTVVAIDREQQKVTLQNGELHYDYLVVGLGSEPETFGIEGLREHAFSINSINSVRIIRQHIEYQFAKFAAEPERTDYLTIVVGGAGFTGIEFVGELADRMPELCAEYDVDPKLVRIINVEAAPTVLPGFDPALVNYAMDVLGGKGVEFKIGTPIKRCTPEGVVIEVDGEEEEIKAATVVWTGGVRGNSIVEKSGFETMRGRIKVDPYLRAPGHENIFIVGDCALIINEENNRPYPPTAQIAIQHGENVAANLAALIRGGSMTPFKPHIRGTVASLGRNDAIGIVGGRKVYGHAASWLKKLEDMRYLYLIGGLSLVLKKGRFHHHHHH
uniref:FAD-dependent pyridine nucleotide-disulfide oxidoreductase n=1 Tax=Caldalkalibacillus thermarum (strain TA2.A1) TaxID=986075 RepID=UPI0009715994|nr:Chain A, FAD-dependent pyridine nucleotide-disulfide oxidoreductase [Caldalkalibacillus thermarum TA2.A1]5KMQ_B Chain B, FAD-dependent pyridine nucleotide-disulfide oxidoreductase [Caldalkalibacillus thermarum TA2.A1]5KMQ_C Chain C, FAD-dependent pyridine nucleotide-disulfide oxidoreductase [Caldalkalibacillus thermarum TA2.A1]5KMQ_D Chain D, FAD-dependent pyridine nucleotide-disulfide oxidoreductase [Caldalkalibacillus thermarum TA2.A1]